MTLVCESHNFLTIPRRYHGEIELLMKQITTDLAAQEALISSNAFEMSSCNPRW